MISTILAAVLSASIAVNVWLFLSLRKKPARPQSVELQEFLVDLFKGGMGLIAVARVNQDDLLLRSPKNK